MTQSAKVLVADDDAHIREVVAFALERAGHHVEQAPDGAIALERIGGGDIDLVVLDVLMPELDGLSLCRTLRERGGLPVILLSSRSEELDRVVGLELGADDYVPKPFSPRELVARVNTVLRRARGPQQQPELRFGALVVDRRRHEVRVGDQPVAMTATELAVLRVLLEEDGRALGRAELIDRAYPHDNHITERTIDTHIRRIRGKLRRFGIDPIDTVHGVGYRSAPRPG